MDRLKEQLMAEVNSHLSAQDDSNLWEAAFDTLLSDVQVCPTIVKKQEVFLQIGACSHWLRPHQIRWTAAGGFAWPEGYLQKYRDHIRNSMGPIGSGLPEFDWFVLLHWNREVEEWQVPSKFFGKKRLVFRAALPTRTKRHLQAAIHTVWTPGPPGDPEKRAVRFYGFRKRNKAWSCVVRSN